MLGLVFVLAAILNTWRSSRVSMVSGLAYLVLLTLAYAVIQRKRKIVRVPQPTT